LGVRKVNNRCTVVGFDTLIFLEDCGWCIILQVWGPPDV
jgi:hypothetical protein